MQGIERQKTLPELVYDAVLDAVCEGTLKPGERVTQDALANRLNVSRLPVGQALKRLETEGFLSQAGRRGLKVAALEADLVGELYSLRSGIDLVCVGEAARRITPVAEERGWQILADGQSALAAGDIPLMISADCDFHWFIYEVACNRQILELMASRWQHLRRVMIHVIDDVTNQQRIWAEHEAIFEAVCAGDSETAEVLARQHVDDASKWLQQAIEARYDELADVAVS